MEKEHKNSENYTQTPITTRTRVDQFSNASPKKKLLCLHTIEKDISSPHERKIKFNHQGAKLPSNGSEQYPIEIDLQENDENKNSSSFTKHNLDVIIHA